MTTYPPRGLNPWYNELRDYIEDEMADTEAAAVAAQEAATNAAALAAAAQQDSADAAAAAADAEQAAQAAQDAADEALSKVTRYPQLEGATLYSYGHSYTRWPVVHTSPRTMYAELLRRRLLLGGGDDVGKGTYRGRSNTPLQDTISGMMSPTLSEAPNRQPGYQQWQPGSRGIVLIQNYANEAASGKNSTKYISGWKHALRTFIRMTQAASIVATSSATTTGTWNTSSGATAQRWWNDDVKWSTTIGSTISYPVTGDEVYVITSVREASDPGPITVHVNSGSNPAITTIDGSNQMESFTSSWSDASNRLYIPGSFRINGLNAAAGTSGAKNLIFKVGSSAVTTFMGGVIIPMADPPYVFVAKEPPRNPGASGAANFATSDPLYRAAIDEVVGEFTNGRVHIVDLADGWQNPDFVSSIDPLNFHPNDLGQQFIADKFEEAIRSVITEPIPGVLTL